MKKIMYVIGLSLIASSVWAACMGPYCFDDTGASIGGNAYNGLGSAMPSMTKANVAVSSPTAKGQLIFCSDCLNFNSGRGTICVSTASATSQNSYVAISSAVATTACQ